jgi:archaeal cell division control protein 6
METISFRAPNSYENQSNQKDDLDNFFDEFLSSKPLFKDKSVLGQTHTPDNILHREDYLNQIAKILAPILRLQKTSNLFIYGKCGTGKSLCVNHVIDKISRIINQRDMPVRIVKINCKLKSVADTEYRIIREILNQLGKEMPSTGKHTNDLYKELQLIIEQQENRLILVLDEIDNLITKAGDEILYNLVRLNPELQKGDIALIGITNDLTIMDNIDSRVKSSLNEEELVFLPYNAVEIQNILKDRCQIAFEIGAVEEEVIPQAAAFAAREHGDARRALELLRFAGELAEREGSEKIILKHMIDADKKTERNRIIDIIKSQPKQFQMVTYSIIKTSMKEKMNLISNKKQKIIEPTTTGAVYDYYNKLAKDLSLSNLSLRRVSDIIVELEILGLINFKIISKGRYGRTRYITIGLPKTLYENIIGILKKDLSLE